MPQGLLERSAWTRGWVPDADKVNGPIDGLLRADNLMLDEKGVIGVRPGSQVVETLADADVHSLYSVLMNGTKRRYVGAGNNVYRDGSAIAAMAGSGDVSFGSYLGQILFARSTSKSKDDGTTPRAWGLSAPNKPTITPVAPDGKTLSTGDSSESPAFVWTEDNGAGAAYDTGHDGTPDGALVLVPKDATRRGVVTKTFGSPQDFTTYDSGGAASDDDILSVFFFVDEPGNLASITLLVDVNDGSFQTDMYQQIWTPGTNDSLTPVSTSSLPTTITGTARSRVRGLIAGDGGTTDQNQNPATGTPRTAGSWTKLQVRRGDMTRIGSTSGTDWSTVKAIQFVVLETDGVTVRFDTCRIVQAGLTGLYQWYSVSAFVTDEYVGLSGPSPISDPVQMLGAVARVNVSGGSGNHIYVFRMGGVMDNFYQTADLTGSSGSVNDDLSDVQAMANDIQLEPDNGPPPDNIIGIAGPYYDRVFVLTSDGLLSPSRRVNPDSFAAGQGVQVSGPDELVYWVKQAFNGLYIGTSKDIYSLDGDGGENPDGTINFLLRPLNVDHPPAADGVAISGSTLIYLADDGWRVWGGSGSQSITGDTSLLYRPTGTRHGLGPLNVTTGRFRAAIHKGQLVTTAPMGSETSSTMRVMRLANGIWYYHPYTVAFRSMHREPDGRLIAGDTGGNVWELYANTTLDNGLPIEVVIWTKCDDDGKPYQRKDPWDLRVRCNSVGTSVSVAVHLDGQSSAANTITAEPTDESDLIAFDLGTMAPAVQFQLRLTCFSTFGFQLYGFGLSYRERPLLQYFAEPKPNLPSNARRRFSGLLAHLDTLGGTALITAILDDTAIAAWNVSTDTPEAKSLTFPTVIGRDLWAKIQKDDGFELYEFTPRILEELPPIVQGLLPKTNLGATGVKRVSAITLRACTLGAVIGVTVFADGLAVGSFSIQSPATEPDDFTLPLGATTTAREVQLQLSGDTEVYDWKPVVSARNPIGIKVWDTGPIDLDQRELVWIRRADIKVNAGAQLTWNFFFDGVLVTAVQTGGYPLNADTIIPVDVPRGTKGRQARVVITSSAPFFPYWVKFFERGSGYGTEKAIQTVSFEGAHV